MHKKSFFLLSLLSVLIFCPPQLMAQNTTKTKVSSRSLRLNEQGATAARNRQLDRAEQLFKQAIAADSYNLTAVFNLAGVYAMNKKEVEAKKLLEDYIKRSPNDAALHARLGDVNFSLEKPSDALKEYQKALELDPNYPSVHAKMAPIFIMQNRPKEAEVALLSAIKEDPKSAILYRNLSAVLLANGKNEESIAAAKKALQMEVSADAYVTLGTAYELSKDLKNALIAYHRALDLGDKRPELKAKIAQLER